MSRDPNYRRSPVGDWLDYLENICVVCGGPQLGVHYHEREEEPEEQWLR